VRRRCALRKESVAEQTLARGRVLLQEDDWKENEKARSAQIFYDKYLQAKSDPEYLRLKQVHKQQYEK